MRTTSRDTVTLLAESGSTKTDWALLFPDGKLERFKTSGINPNLQTAEEIQDVLRAELPIHLAQTTPDKVHYFGAGISGHSQQLIVQEAIASVFKCQDISVEGDLLAAALALCGDGQGIVCILGTGSNSCYFEKGAIQTQQVSLGYIAGDEGSGNYMGKRILQYYAYGTFDDELSMAFEKLFGNDMQAIIHRLYNQSFPNRYLASLVKLLVENRGHYMVENILEDCLNDFFHFHILKYRESWYNPIYFAGSIAWEFRDVVET